MFTVDEVKKIQGMLESGMTHRVIAEKMGCSTNTIHRILKGDYTPNTVKKCIICGKEFLKIGGRRQVLCGDAKCSYERRKQINAKWNGKRRETKNYDTSVRLVREYTDTANMMIVVDLEKGYSLEYIAKAYSRDKNDLQKHIEKIKADGTIEKIKKNLERYRKNKREALLGG